jgi:hypothetical protein
MYPSWGYPRGVLDRREYEDPQADPAVTLEALMAAAYPDPNPYDTAESFTRYSHDDIGRLSDEDLTRECIRARLAWAFSASPSPWLRTRIGRLEAAARARQRPKAR